MVEPCNCLGDFQYVHVDCWSEWLNEDFDERDMGCQRCESNWKIDSEEDKIQKIDMENVQTSDLPPEFQQAAMSDRLERVLYTSWFRISTKQASEREKRILREVGGKIPGPWTKWVQQDAKRRNSFIGKVENKMEAARERRQSFASQRSLSMGKANAGSLQRRPSLQLRRPSLFGGHRDQVFQLCRICGQNDEVMNLVEPCHCTDKELKFVHINCWKKAVCPEDGDDKEVQKSCDQCHMPWKVDPKMDFKTKGETEDPDAPEVSERLIRALECAWFRVSTGQAGAREFGILADAGAKVKGPWDTWVRKQGKKKEGKAEDLLDGDKGGAAKRAKCRICQETSSVAHFISPCKCTGDAQYLHPDCWVKFVRDDPEHRMRKCIMCDSDWTTMPDLVEYGTPDVEVSQRLMRALQTAWFRISTGGCGPTELELVTQAGVEVPGPWSKWLEERDKRRNSVGGRMVRSLSIGQGAGSRRPSFLAGSAQAAENAVMDPVEAARLATEAAATAEDEEEQKKNQIKLARSISRGRRAKGFKPRISTVTESVNERGSIIMKRASILLMGDPVQKKKGLFSCCSGGGKAAKYEIEDEKESNSTAEEEEDEGW